MNRPTRRQAMQTSLAGLGMLTVPTSALPATSHPKNEYSFHHDHVIGTSLDVWLFAADAKDACLAEQAILSEVERLRLIFSTFDPASEINWLNRADDAVVVSPELLHVLRLYDRWQACSGGAFSGRLGELVSVWKHAAATGIEPEPSTLARLVQRSAEPAWAIDDASGTVTRLSEQPLNLNSIAKGFIIDRAMASARAKVPTLSGLLLNLGGDLRVWNDSGWVVGVQNPHRPADNARPLTAIQLRDASVATSGGYLRSYQVAGQRWSHLFDPRTGRSATGIASATVVANDSVTANALATTLCVLNPEDGLRLVAATPGAECLIVLADGEALRSGGFRELELPMADETACSAMIAAEAWPDGYEVLINIELPKIATPKYRKPYVAIWVEDAKGKPVRSIAVWGNSQKYLRDLFDWWKFARGDSALIKTVTRATRSPGKYSVVWDGKDDQGVPVPQGTYTVKVEVHREHGKHLTQSGKIRCETSDSKVTLDKNAETEATVVEYGKKK